MASMAVQPTAMLAGREAGQPCGRGRVPSCRPAAVLGALGLARRVQAAELGLHDRAGHARVRRLVAEPQLAELGVADDVVDERAAGGRRPSQRARVVTDGAGWERRGVRGMPPAAALPAVNALRTARQPAPGVPRLR
jgi:hypothetical protein